MSPLQLSRMHHLVAHQRFAAPRQQVWDVCRDPRFLLSLCPPSMRFECYHEAAARQGTRAHDRLPHELYPGLILRYRLNPLPVLLKNLPEVVHNTLRIHWTTHIPHVHRGWYFVDTPLQAPYRDWHHEHFFLEADDAHGGGCVMVDLVHYTLPIDLPVVEPVHRAFVSRELAGIFGYRQARLREALGAAPLSNEGGGGPDAAAQSGEDQRHGRLFFNADTRAQVPLPDNFGCGDLALDSSLVLDGDAIPSPGASERHQS